LVFTIWIDGFFDSITGFCISGYFKHYPIRKEQNQVMFDLYSEVASISLGDTNKFLELFNEIKSRIIKNPDMLGKSFWD